MGIVITGIGVVSPLGTGWPAFREAVLGDGEGLTPLALEGAPELPCSLGGAARGFDPAAVLGAKGLRLIDRTTRLSLAAAKLALDHAGIDPASIPPGRLGLALGTVMGSSESRTEFSREGIAGGARAVNPGKFPNTVVNSPAAQVALRFGLTGPNSTLSAGAGSDLEAIDFACQMLQADRASLMLAGGVQALSPIDVWYLERAGLLSKRGRPRPFDRERDGTVPGEAAVLFLLEPEAAARAREACILGRIEGIERAADTRRLRGFSRSAGRLPEAIRLALEAAGRGPGEIAWVASGADGSRRGDRSEASALAAALGGRPRVTALKSRTGETLGASGALGAAAALAGLEAGRIPPMLEVASPDPRCPVEPVTETVECPEGRHVLVTASGPAGTSIAMVVSSIRGTEA